ncbi:hypothetical protein [Methylomonas koyamae]|uniref:hypothetical protein n=1 Tax=Methylomonas koyamae TaxID=702114 RepID=UPI0028731F4F|nr:hypothetical protein [Methylomonas koyamae]WNB75918.1 hypothetical protein RI210_22015 [Methylomonas koyamae]
MIKKIIYFAVAYLFFITPQVAYAETAQEKMNRMQIENIERQQKMMAPSNQQYV